jgi:hypothetical protein
MSRVATWSIALAVGLSFTRPSDLRIEQPGAGNRAVFHDVRWAGQSFVSPLYYVVRAGFGDVQVDFTHYKVIAETNERILVTGVWHGNSIDETAPLGERVQHFEVSHGVNALAVVAIAHDPFRRGAYAGVGPLVFLPHVEGTVDGRPVRWGYGFGGTGFEMLAGVGIPAPWAEAKYDEGSLRVGLEGGTASTRLSTLSFSFAP